jgi:hypothetical protein
LTDLHTAQQNWDKTLEQLQLQMPKTTFDTWIKDLRLVTAENNHYTVAAASTYAQDWIQNRLFAPLQRTLNHVAGGGIELIIITAALPSPSLPPVEGEGNDAFWGEIPLDILAFDTFDAGYFPQANYIQRCWGAHLGALGMQFINHVRSFYPVQRYSYDKKAKGLVVNPNWQPWTPAREFHAMELARALKCDYHQIIGRWRTCHKYNADTILTGQGRVDCWCGLHPGELAVGKPTEQFSQGKPICHWWREGLFDRLLAEGIITIEKQGDLDKIATVYFKIQVFQPLPLLTPWQVARLPDPVQKEHRKFLLNRVNLAQWEQITVERLMPYIDRYLGSLLSK